MHCSANSTAMQHEALFRVSAPGECVGYSLGSGRDIPRSGRSGAISLAQAKALLQDPLRCPQAQASDRVLHDRPSVLHLQAMRKLSWFLRDFGYDSAGANLENEDPTVLLQSMAPFFKFLPGDQRQAFLHEVTAKAS